MKLSDKFKLIKIFDPKSGLKSQMYASRPSAKDKLTKEQLEVLRIMSRNELQFQQLLHNSPQKINRWIKLYHFEKPIIEDLNKHGIKVKDLEDLRYPDFDSFFIEALPILVKWLKKKTTQYEVKNTIIHILIDKPISKKYAFDAMIDIFRTADRNYRDKWGFQTSLFVMLGNALMRWVDDDHAPIIFNLLKDEKNKEDNFLLASVANFKKPENIESAKELIGKELLTTRNNDRLCSVISTLRKLKATETKELIKKFLTHPNSEVKREAKKTIALFDMFEKSSTQKSSTRRVV